jgi:cytochrome c
VASASFDNSVGLWTDRTPLGLEGHDEAVIGVTFAGRDLLLTGGDDFRVIAWHLDTGAHQTIVEHKG